MTSIKDKLTSSVRQAKTAADPAPADKTEEQKAPRSASVTSTKEAPAKPAPSAKATPADSLAAEPPPSQQELFPDRIWPD